MVRKGKLHIIRKPGYQYCPDCIQEDKEPNEKDKRTPSLMGCSGLRFQVWHILLWGTWKYQPEDESKEPILTRFSQQMIKHWIEAHYNFVLEWDKALGHRPGKIKGLLYASGRRRQMAWNSTSSKLSFITRPCPLSYRTLLASKSNNIFKNIRTWNDNIMQIIKGKYFPTVVRATKKLYCICLGNMVKSRLDHANILICIID